MGALIQAAAMTAIAIRMRDTSAPFLLRIDFRSERRDAFMRFFEKVAHLKFFDEPFVVGERFERVAGLEEGLSKIKVDRVSTGELRILFEQRLEAIHRS